MAVSLVGKAHVMAYMKDSDDDFRDYTTRERVVERFQNYRGGSVPVLIGKKLLSSAFTKALLGIPELRGERLHQRLGGYPELARVSRGARVSLANHSHDDETRHHTDQRPSTT
jgi:hypothetical protein